MEKDYILEVKNLRKYFKTSKGTLHAVENASFSLERGKTLGVVGESGCGKSTLGRTVIRLTAPTSGQILFENNDISRIKGNELKKYRRNLQMIFQDPFSSLNPRMSVSQIIAEPLIIYNECRDKIELGRRVAQLMDTVGLARRLANSYPHELDGGRRQRIGIARALSLDPGFIVCDEPVSALDVSIQAQVLNLIQDLQEEKRLSYLFITHNMAVIRHIADDIMVMYMGSIVEFTTNDELFQNPLHPYTRALLSAVPEPSIHVTRNRHILKDEVGSPIDPRPGCRFASRCPYAEDLCFTENPVLREAAPKHTVACHYLEKAAEV